MGRPWPSRRIARRRGSSLQSSFHAVLAFSMAWFTWLQRPVSDPPLHQEYQKHSGALGRARRSETDPWDRPSTDSPNNLWLMEY